MQRHHVIVHEYGHALHEALLWQPAPTPTTAYAQTNRYEAFAEAFTSYLYHGYGHWPDPRTVALFDAL